MVEEGKDKDTGVFLPGNKFWLHRSSHGRKPIYSSPSEFHDACIQYLSWVDENPLYEQKAFHANGIITTHNLPKMRAMTLTGLCVFIGISFDTWTNYAKKADFIGIIREIDAIIKTQKFEGAAADMLNANIIARDLGLTDGPVEDKTEYEDDGFDDAIDSATKKAFE